MQSEINERISFLNEMTKLGKRREYEAIIKLEISQVIHFIDSEFF